MEVAFLYSLLREKKTDGILTKALKGQYYQDVVLLANPMKELVNPLIVAWRCQNALH